MSGFCSIPWGSCECECDCESCIHGIKARAAAKRAKEEREIFEYEWNREG